MGRACPPQEDYILQIPLYLVMMIFKSIPLRLITSLIAILLCCLSCDSVAQETETPTKHFISFYINESVTNAEEDYAQTIIENWKNYLLSGDYVLKNSPYYLFNNKLTFQIFHFTVPYWIYGEMERPDYSYVRLLLGLRHLKQNNDRTQCNIIVVIPFEREHYLLKCMFTQIEDLNLFIVS